MTSTSGKVGGVFGKYGVLNAVVNDLYFLAQKSKSAKIPVKGDLIMFSSHCTFKYKTLSFCHKNVMGAASGGLGKQLTPKILQILQIGEIIYHKFMSVCPPQI